MVGDLFGEVKQRRSITATLYASHFERKKVQASDGCA